MSSSKTRITVNLDKSTGRDTLRFKYKRVPRLPVSNTHLSLSLSYQQQVFFWQPLSLSLSITPLHRYFIMRIVSPWEAASHLGSILLVASTVSALAATANSVDTYDYVVVGSGPGGGPLAANLARSGFKTLLLEAGDDDSAAMITNAIALTNTADTTALTWTYWVRHYDDVELTKRYRHLTWRLPDGKLWVGPGSEAPAGAEIVGIQYPRGATLGGSSIVNSALTVLPADSDWDYIKNLTGDESWKYGIPDPVFYHFHSLLFRGHG